MRIRTLLVSTAVLALLAAIPAFSQVRVKKVNTERPSPDAVASEAIGGKQITVEYSSPRVKGRKIFGALVPYGEVWRAGANEATVLTVDGDTTVGDLKVPAGSYALMILPKEGGWTLILNKVAHQWGAFKYQESEDLGRTAMKVSKTPGLVEDMTFAIESTGPGKGLLKLMWENTMATVPLTVP